MLSIATRKQETIERINAVARERIKAAETPDQQIAVVQVAVVGSEYVRHYFDRDFERFEVRSVEKEYLADVVNPETGRPSGVFDHASKLDGFAWDRFNGEEVVVEHKSTSEPLAVWSPYWRKLVIDSQVSKYLLTLRQCGRHDVRSVLYDVVSKPNTKPKEIPKASVPPIVESGLYHGFPLTPKTLAWVRETYAANQGAKGGFTGKLRENLELYGLRIRRDIVNDPESTFSRKTITRTDDELREYARELWEHARELREARKTGVWPKNSAACSSFGRTCEFFPVCCGERSQDSDGFVKAPWVHDELETLSQTVPNGGRDLLTNSRLVLLQSCKRRHYLRYEVGLRKESETEAAALFWGSLFHEFMEIVWNAYTNERV